MKYSEDAGQRGCGDKSPAPALRCPFADRAIAAFWAAAMWLDRPWNRLTGEDLALRTRSKVSSPLRFDLVK